MGLKSFDSRSLGGDYDGDTHVPKWKAKLHKLVRNKKGKRRKHSTSSPKKTNYHWFAVIDIRFTETYSRPAANFFSRWAAQM